MRLVGDGTLYQKMLTEAQQATKQAAQMIEEASKRIEAISQGLQTFGKTALSVLAGFGLAGGLKSAFDSYSKTERGIISLNAAIEASGNEVDSTSARFATFAESITRSTLASKGQVFSLIQMGLNMGLTAEQSQRAAKNAIGFAGANHEQAESLHQAAYALEKGDIRALRFALGLRRAGTDADVLRIAQQRLSSGIKAAHDVTNTASGRIEKLQRALGGVSRDIGGLVAQAILPALNFLGQLVSQFNTLSSGTKKAIAVTVGLVLALKMIPPTVALISSLLSILKLKQLASLILWGLWKTMVLGVNLVIGLFNVQLALWNTLTSGSAIATGAWSAIVLVAKAVTWLWNAALSAMNALLAPATILAVASTAAILVGGFILLTAAGWGVYQAATAVFEALGTLSTTSGPLGAVLAVLSEWWEVVKDVGRAIQVNLPLAAQIAKTGFMLAVAQVRQLWEPLWSFIQEGWKAVSELAADTFRLAFLQALANIQREVASWVQSFGIQIGPSAAEVAKMNQEVREAQEGMARVAKARLALAQARFKLPEDSEEVKQLREQLKGLHEELEKTERGEEAMPDPYPELQEHAKSATKEVQKFDAALAGSAEAATRVQDYIDRTRYGSDRESRADNKKAPAFNLNVTQGAGGGEAEKKAGESLGILKQIRDGVNKQASKPGINLGSADLD